MDTIKIRHLELYRTELLSEKKSALQIKCYSRARNLHIQIRKMERAIKKEQTILWNFALKKSLSLNNIDLIEDIFRYFDQKNYQLRVMDKIENQIRSNQEEVSQLISLQQYELACVKQNENLYLINLLNKIYEVNEEEISGTVCR